MNLLAFLGIPDCGVYGCQNPGIVRVEIEGENGKAFADLCIACLPKFGPVLHGVSQAAHEELPLLESEELP